MDVELISVSFLAPFIYEAIKAIFRKISSLQDSKRVEKELFEKALSSDNLAEVGAYFSNKFSKVKLVTYTEDRNVKGKIDVYLKKIGDFVEVSSEDADTYREISNSIKESDEPHSVQARPDDPEVIKRALESIKLGDSWSGLARVRRDIESRLRKNVSSGEYLPLLKLAYLIEMPRGVLHSLRRFLSVANAAIHGEDTDLDETLIALEEARNVYAYLDGMVSKKPA